MSGVAHPGVRLEAELRKRGWTQANLAWVLDCNAQNVNKLIRGYSLIGTRRAKAIGAALDLDPLDILRWWNAYALSCQGPANREIATRAATLNAGRRQPGRSPA